MKMTCMLFLLSIASQAVFSKEVKRDFYQLQVYHLKNDNQVKMTDQFLEDAFLPALHRLTIKNIGVFKPVGNDTAAEKLIYVLIPFSSAEAWTKITAQLQNDASFKQSGKAFLEASATNPPYDRVESILMEAFSGQPHLVLPASKNPERVFELRSYESPTQRLHEKKVDMINTGGEIEIFSRLGFNPVFCGDVVSGSRMPNLMYLPIFENLAERDAQWKRFRDDAKCKEISAMPEHESKVSVSHIDSTIMHSTDYSDY